MEGSVGSVMSKEPRLSSSAGGFEVELDVSDGSHEMFSDGDDEVDAEGALLKPPPASPAKDEDVLESGPASSGALASAASAALAAPPSAAAAVPPPPAPHPVDRPPRNKLSYMWGRFRISPVFSAGVQTGWGATCRMHVDANCVAECKRNLGYRGRSSKDPIFDDAACVRQLKRWLIAGLSIDPALPNAKTLHFDMDIRSLGPQSHPENLEAPPAA